MCGVVPALAMLAVPPVVEGEERALSAGLAAGDRAAFRAIIERHQSMIARYCERFVGDRALAGDLTQEVFLTLWQERARYREEGRLKYYLLQIARLRCLAACKRRRSQRRLAADYAESRDDEAAPVEAGFAAAAVRRALARLAPAHADLILLRHLEDLDLEEIRAVTGLRIGTIKSRLSRGLVALRKELDHDR